MKIDTVRYKNAICLFSSKTDVQTEVEKFTGIFYLVGSGYRAACLRRSQQNNSEQTGQDKCAGQSEQPE
jgi:hypothetical protein